MARKGSCRGARTRTEAPGPNPVAGLTPRRSGFERNALISTFDFRLAPTGFAGHYQFRRIGNCDDEPPRAGL